MSGDLSTRQQFGLGCFGAALVVLGQAFGYLHSLPSDSVWPDAFDFSTVLTIILWAMFIPAGGGLSYAFETHLRIAAVYEGASLPALFFFLGRHLYSQ